jgi:hypothetical protein
MASMAGVNIVGMISIMIVVSIVFSIRRPVDPGPDVGGNHAHEISRRQHFHGWKTDGRGWWKSSSSNPLFGAKRQISLKD